MNPTERRRWHPGWRDSHRRLDDVEDKVTVWRLIARARRRRWPLRVDHLKVLLLRFGFLGGSLSLAEVGDVLGLSRERVRQMEAKALRKLREAAGLRMEQGETRTPDHPPYRWPVAWSPPAGHSPAAEAGPLELICDRCQDRWRSALWHRGGRIPPERIAIVRMLGTWHGWNTKYGDVCPRCSLPKWSQWRKVGPDRTARPVTPWVEASTNSPGGQHRRDAVEAKGDTSSGQRLMPPRSSTA